MSITGRKCVKCGLTRAADITVTYHRFPNPGKATREKAQAWAKFCWPDQDWSSLDSLKALHFGSKILCGRHFLTSQFIDEDRKRLFKNAVPTVSNMEYHKSARAVPQVKAEVKAEVFADEDELNTEVEYLSDWETLEDISNIQDPANVSEPDKIKNDSKNATPVKIEPVKIESYSVNIKDIKKEPRSAKKQIKSTNVTPVIKNTYTIKTEDVKTEPLSVKNECCSIKTEVQSPVLSEIVRRALSKSGVTMKRIVKPIPEIKTEIKTKELDIKTSGVQSRRAIIKNNNNNRSCLDKKHTSINNGISDFDKSMESHIGLEMDDGDGDGENDDAFVNDDPNDEDYHPCPDEGEQHVSELTKKGSEKSKQSVESRSRGPCRCCLREGEHRATDILRVLSCLNIHPSTDPELSALVCDSCELFLQRATRFRNMVATSEVELSSRLQPPLADDDDDGGDDADADAMEVDEAKEHCYETRSDPEAPSDEDDDDEVYVPVQESDDEIEAEARPRARRVRRRKTPPPGVLNNKSRLKTLRENILTIIMNSTIIPFTYNKNPLLVNHYECIYYDARYTEFHDLRKHMEKHHPVPDEKHIETFVNQLQKGILRADISDIKCRRCGEPLDNIDDLVHHLVIEHGLKYTDLKWDPPHNILGFDLSSEELKCPVCVKLFTTFRGLLAHMNQHYGSFLCPLCGMKFLYPDSFSKHKKNHLRALPIKSVICDICGVSLTSRKALEKHKKYQCRSIKLHNKPKIAKPFKKPKRINVDKYDCLLCGEKFTNGTELYEHRIEHLNRSKDKKLVCEICKYVAPKKNQMRRHFKRHFGIKDVFCHVCNKGFVSMQDLRFHSNVHLARFQCPFCTEVCFMSKRECSYHIKTDHCDLLPKNT